MWLNLKCRSLQCFVLWTSFYHLCLKRGILWKFLSAVGIKSSVMLGIARVPLLLVPHFEAYIHVSLCCWFCCAFALLAKEGKLAYRNEWCNEGFPSSQFSLGTIVGCPHWVHSETSLRYSCNYPHKHVLSLCANPFPFGNHALASSSSLIGELELRNTCSLDP